jgi:anthranilate phosphoribosyltransferase
LVVSSTDGLDELSIAAPTQVVEVNGTKIDSYTVSPEDVGLPTTPDPQATAGGEPPVSARITRSILAGEDGPRSDLAVLNAGAAIYAGGGVPDLAAGVAAAREAIATGAATDTLERLIAVTHELAATAEAR